MAVAVIKSIEEKTYQGKVTGHSITLDNGVTGYLNDKGSDDLKQGESTEYSLEVKKNAKGGNYNLLTLKRVSGGTQPPPPPPSSALHPSQLSTGGKYTTSRSQQEWKAQASIDAMGFMVDAVATGKIDWPQIREKQREACTILWDEIDEIFGGKG